MDDVYELENFPRAEENVELLTWTENFKQLKFLSKLLHFLRFLLSGIILGEEGKGSHGNRNVEWWRQETKSGQIWNFCSESFCWRKTEKKNPRKSFNWLHCNHLFCYKRMRRGTNFTVWTMNSRSILARTALLFWFGRWANGTVNGYIYEGDADSCC